MTSAPALYAKITATFDAGGNVLMATAYRVTKFTPKHRAMIKVGKDGQIYIQRGRSWLCCPIGGCGWGFETPARDRRA